MTIQDRLINIQLQEDTHSTHIEDSILKGPEYIERMLNFFDQSISVLEGSSNSDTPNPTVKIDGAPAITMFSDFPGFDGAGVSTKSIFNANPKVYYNDSDIDKDNRPDGLKNKLKAALKLAKEEIIPAGQIWQGDLLWTKGDAKEQDNFVYVKPNTLVYAAPKGSELANSMKNKEIGIVFHTRYQGSSISSVRQSNDVSKSELNNIPDWAFVIDAQIENGEGKVNWTAEETDIINDLFDELKSHCDRILNKEDYEELCANTDFIQFYVMTLQNYKVDQQTDIDPEQFVEDLHQWITSKMRGKYVGLDKLKTKKGRDSNRDKIGDMSQMLHRIVQNNANLIEDIAQGLNLATELKAEIMSKMEEANRFMTMVEKRDGSFNKTGGEGFVVSDIDGNFVKLVDRKSFSYFNRSPDVVKGFEHPELKESQLREGDLQSELDFGNEEDEENIEWFGYENENSKEEPATEDEVILEFNTKEEADEAVEQLNNTAKQLELFESLREGSSQIAEYQVGEWEFNRRMDADAFLDELKSKYTNKSYNATSSKSENGRKFYVKVEKVIDQKTGKEKIKTSHPSVKEIKPQEKNKAVPATIKDSPNNNNILSILKNKLPKYDFALAGTKIFIAKEEGGYLTDDEVSNIMPIINTIPGAQEVAYTSTHNLAKINGFLLHSTAKSVKSMSSGEQIKNKTPVQEFLSGLIIKESFKKYNTKEIINRLGNDHETFFSNAESQLDSYNKEYKKFTTPKQKNSQDALDLYNNKILATRKSMAEIANIPRAIMAEILGLDLEISNKTQYLEYKTATQKTVDYFKNIIKVPDASIESINNFFKGTNVASQTWFNSLTKLGLPRFINQFKNMYSNGAIDLKNYELYHPDIPTSQQFEKIIRKRNLSAGKTTVDRDTVCPADILFVKNGTKSSIINEFERDDSRKNYIDLMNKYFRDKTLIPVSLKKNTLSELDSVNVSLIINSADEVFNSNYKTFFQLSKNLRKCTINTSNFVLSEREEGNSYSTTLEVNEACKEQCHFEAIDIIFSKANGNWKASTSMEASQKPSRGAKIGRFVTAFFDELVDAGLQELWFKILLDDGTSGNITPDLFRKKQELETIKATTGLNKTDLKSLQTIYNKLGISEELDENIETINETFERILRESADNSFKERMKKLGYSSLSKLLNHFAEIFFKFLRDHPLKGIGKIKGPVHRQSANLTLILSRAAKYPIRSDNTTFEQKLADYAKIS